MCMRVWILQILSSIAELESRDKRLSGEAAEWRCAGREQRRTTVSSCDPGMWSWNSSTGGDSLQRQLNNTDDERNTWQDSRGWLVISEWTGMKHRTSRSLLLLETCKMYQNNDVIHRQAPPLTTDDCDVKRDMQMNWLHFLSPTNVVVTMRQLWKQRQEERWQMTKKISALFLEQLCNTMNYSKCCY